MNKQKIIKKGKFQFVECWQFPKQVDEFIRETLQRLEIPEKAICHCFCGKSPIGGLRIDKEPNNKPDLVADILDLPDILGLNSQKAILADPPWSIPNGKRRYFSYAMRDILQPNGYLILNAPWDGWVEGLELLEVWKVRQSFNSYRDLVDFWIYRKMTPEELEHKKQSKKITRFKVIVGDLELNEAEQIREYLEDSENRLGLHVGDVIGIEPYEIRILNK